jgi:putative membrane protein
LFEAALKNGGLHMLEHGSFFATALLLWRGVLHIKVRRRIGPAIGAVFMTLLHAGLLGALITLTPHPLYLTYLASTNALGLTPLGDQQLAGLLMWIPLGTFYLAAGLWLASRLVAGDAQGERMGIP